MGFMSIVFALFFIVPLAGFIVITIIALIVAEIVCFVLSIVFLALAIVMLVISHKRKKQNKRRVPFLPIGIGSLTSAALLTAVWASILGVAISVVAIPPSGYVETTVIDEKEYEEEFHVNGVKYCYFPPKGSGLFSFNSNALRVEKEAVFSYKPTLPRNWDNFYKLPNAGEENNFDIVFSSESEYSNEYFIREDQMKAATDYYRSTMFDGKNAFTTQYGNKKLNEECVCILNKNIYVFNEEYYTKEQQVELSGTYFQRYCSRIYAYTTDMYVDKGNFEVVKYEDEWYFASDSNLVKVCYKLPLSVYATLDSIFEY